MKIERVPCNNNVFTGEELLDVWSSYKGSCFMNQLTGVVYILMTNGDLLNPINGTSMLIRRDAKYELVDAKLVVCDPAMK